jgi:CRP/FNR family transcriptional regulator, cyclic AMP receptor protein
MRRWAQNVGVIGSRSIRVVAESGPLEEQKRLLAMVDILEPLSPLEIEHLALRSTAVRLEAGETFVLDENRRELLIIMSGRVRVHEPAPDGKDLTLSVVEGGTIVGQSGFVGWRPRTLRMQALEPAVVRFLDWDDFEELVRRNPEVGIRMIQLLSARLSVCEDRVSDLVRKDVAARLASIILRLSEYEGIVVRDGSRKLPTHYTHQQLGSMIGANREAVTRALKRLRETGAVDVRCHHIHVTDLDALERLAESEL